MAPRAGSCGLRPRCTPKPQPYLYSSLPGEVSVSTSCASVMRTACGAARVSSATTTEKTLPRVRARRKAPAARERRPDLVREVVHQRAINIIIVLDVFAADVCARRTCGASAGGTTRCRCRSLLRRPPGRQLRRDAARLARQRGGAAGDGPGWGVAARAGGRLSSSVRGNATCGRQGPHRTRDSRRRRKSDTERGARRAVKPARGRRDAPTSSPRYPKMLRQAASTLRKSLPSVAPRAVFVPVGVRAFSKGAPFRQAWPLAPRALACRAVAGRPAAASRAATPRRAASDARRSACRLAEQCSTT